MAATFPDRFVDRTIAFVRYHSGYTPAGDSNVVNKIPALFLAAGTDPADFNAPDEALWKSGRAASAPWAFVVEPDATHGGDTKKSDDFVIPWVTAVIRQRLGPNGTSLRTVAENAGWLGNNETGEIAPYSIFTGLKTETSWLPDEASARAWQTVSHVAK